MVLFFLFVYLLRPVFAYEVIDTPYAETLQRGYFCTIFRMYGEGSIFTQIVIGLTDQVTIGTSLDIERLIGKGKIRARKFPPTISLRLLLTEGVGRIPKSVLGYEHIGCGEVPGKGLYICFMKETTFWNIPFVWQIGLNSDIQDKKDLYGFCSLSISLNPALHFLAEIDAVDIGGEKKGLKNVGLRYDILPSLGIQFEIRDIGEDRNLESNRTLRIQYKTPLF